MLELFIVFDELLSSVELKLDVVFNNVAVIRLLLPHSVAHTLGRISQILNQLHDYCISLLSVLLGREFGP